MLWWQKRSKCILQVFYNPPLLNCADICILVPTFPTLQESKLENYARHRATCKTSLIACPQGGAWMKRGLQGQECQTWPHIFSGHTLHWLYLQNIPEEIFKSKVTPSSSIHYTLEDMSILGEKKEIMKYSSSSWKIHSLIERQRLPARKQLWKNMILD